MSVRLELVDELVLSVLPKRDKKDGGHDHPEVTLWKELKKETEGLFKIRSRIAHHRVDVRTDARFRESGEPMPLNQPVPIEQLAFTSSFELYVSEAERLRGRHEKATPLKVDDLSIHCVQVQRAAQRLHHFRAAKLQAHLK